MRSISCYGFVQCIGLLLLTIVLAGGQGIAVAQSTLKSTTVCASVPDAGPYVVLVSPAAKDAYPDEEWERWETPELGNFCSESLELVHERLKGMSTSAMVVISGGRVVFEYGDLSEVSYVASVRKSILAMLYGIYVADGTIDLDRTLEQMDIEDRQGLTPEERQAKIEHIIASRSGVYHPASNSGDNLSAAPERGSQAPGEYFLYSNWDFNVAGTIFEQETGTNLFDALQSHLAEPLGFQDFNRDRHRKGGNLRRSQHPSYHMHLSTRDMARVGYLMLREGRWEDTQIIPRDWVHEIVRPITPLSEMNPPSRRRGPFGYGYMWWVWDGRFATGSYEGAYTGIGAVGQYITVVPKLDVVVAHKTVPGDNRRVNHGEYRRLLDLLLQAHADYQPQQPEQPDESDLVIEIRR